VDPSLWGNFHDATLLSAQGSVPGTIVLTLECQYLRQMFGDTGDSFLLHLNDCSLFEFEPFDKPAIADLSEISQLELEILSSEVGDPLEVCCVSGILRVRYGSAQAALDSGQSVSLPELDAASENYWTQWEQRHRADS
jgi:hypothetical protein